jgi:isocitrate dehydrogenase (NAD+)
MSTQTQPVQVTLVQGGGVGHDQVPAVKRILEAAGVDIAWEDHVAGVAAIEQGLPPLPVPMLDSVRKNGLALKTKILLPPRGPHGNYNLDFRKALGLYAAVRPIRNLKGLPARFQDVDMLVIRELTEDLYAAIEHQIIPGVVQSIKVVTERASLRFFRFAFEWARAHGRKTIHCVHKANILKLADGLFLDAFRAVAKQFPDLQTKEIIVDNSCMQMVSRPQQFDVLVMGNLYGDIVSDLGAGIVGGISATAGINVGDGIRVFETFHGGAREEIGAGKANPLPLLLPAIALLESVRQQEAGARILGAVEVALKRGKIQTVDRGGQSTTTEIADAVIAELPKVTTPTGN